MRITYVAITRDLLSSQLQTYCHERWLLDQYLNKKWKQLKYPFLKKLTSKEKATFLWFDLFFWVIIINYIPPERKFNEHSKNLNRKVLW